MTSPTANAPAGGIIRIATFTAKPSRMDDLIESAKVNGATALEQDGCLSAEVAMVPDNPDKAIVVSRWVTVEALQKYLDWHQSIAYSSMAPSTTDETDAKAGKPVSVHYLVV